MQKLSLTLTLFTLPFLLIAEIKKVETEKFIAPIILRKALNPVLKFNIISEGKEKISAIQLILKGERNIKMSDIKKIEIFKSLLNEKTNDPIMPFLEAPGAAVAEIKGNQINQKSGIATLKNGFNTNDGNNHYWISVELDEKTPISNIFNIELKSIRSENKTINIENGKTSQRIGVAITTPDQETHEGKNVRRSKFFRIPGLTRSKKGTMIAVFDNRYGHNGDLPANIDVGVSRSTDGGQTWGPIIVAMTKNIAGLGNGVGDPAILTDTKTGKIWIAALGAPKSGHPIWASVAGSASPTNCGQFILAYSDNDGLTWSDPINITEPIKRLKDGDTKNWGCIFQGPGNGFTMKNGTLVFPSQVWTKNPDGNTGSSLGVLVYSKDRGKTWKSSKATTFDNIHASESQAAELSDGSIMFNARNEQRNGYRFVATTKNLGETWEKHETDRNNKTGLRESTCQGCLISVPAIGKDKDVLFFSNPNAGDRSNMSLKYSTNDGKKWSEGFTYDSRRGMGYSAIYPTDKKNIGVFYETDQKFLVFLKIPYKDIMEEK